MFIFHHEHSQNTTNTDTPSSGLPGSPNSAKVITQRKYKQKRW